MQTAAET